jgi:hypothetical protein
MISSTSSARKARPSFPGPHFAGVAILKPHADANEVEAFEVASRDADFLTRIFLDGILGRGLLGLCRDEIDQHACLPSRISGSRS